MDKKRYKTTSAYFEKVAALNEIIDKGGEAAKDAGRAKSQLITPSANAAPGKNGKRKKSDLLDSKARFPGSFESGKRR